MPRRAEVQWWASRGGYYGRVDGVPNYVGPGPDDKADNGPNYRAAVGRWLHLLQLAHAADKPDQTTVRVLAEKYLQARETELAPASLQIRKQYLTPFVADYGERYVATLTGDDLRAFLERMQAGRNVEYMDRWQKTRSRFSSWSRGGCVNFIRCLRSACRWAVEDGCLERIPKGLGHRQTYLWKRRDTILTVEQEDAILTRSRVQAKRLFLQALSATGARPSELIHATGRDWDSSQGAIIYLPDGMRPAGRYRHKTAGRGRTRVILFQGALRAWVDCRAKECPDGPLFPNSRGKRFCPSTLRVFLRDAGRVLHIPGLSPYTYRHTFATRWILKGGSVEMLAELMGNTPAMIYKHYSHLLKDRSALRAALERLAGPETEGKA